VEAVLSWLKISFGNFVVDFGLRPGYPCVQSTVNQQLRASLPPVRGQKTRP